MLFILVVSPERFKYTNSMLLLFVWWSAVLTDWRRITDKCYHVDSSSDAMHWFPSGDDVHFCDCIDTKLTLKNLQAVFLEWRVLALFVIYSVLRRSVTLQAFTITKRKKKRQKEKSQVSAPRPLAREAKRDTARKANPEKMGRWVPEATTHGVRHG